MRKIIYYFIIVLLFASCEKEELPLIAPVSNTPIIDTSGGENLIAKGNITTNSVSMDADYKHQIWFDLGTNSIVKTNLRTDWDLAFDCGLNKNILYLNSALVAKVAFTDTSDFNAVNSDAGLTYTSEHQSGNSETLAIGDITEQRNVFIIDRGFNPSGNPIGKWKVQITLVENQSYYLTCSKLNGDNLTTAVITKDPLYNRVAFSFKTLSVIQIEPLKTDYDLCFTQYTNVFTNPPLAYSVNGVIINPYHTEVAEEFNLEFNAITKSHAETLFYSKDADIIGYDWKEFLFSTQSYTIYQDQNYIIKDASGNLFILHFLDFYDENGVKGTPGFEFVRI